MGSIVHVADRSSTCRSGVQGLFLTCRRPSRPHRTVTGSRTHLTPASASAPPILAPTCPPYLLRSRQPNSLAYLASLLLLPPISRRPAPLSPFPLLHLSRRLWAFATITDPWPHPFLSLLFPPLSSQQKLKHWRHIHHTQKRKRH